MKDQSITSRIAVVFFLIIAFLVSEVRSETLEKVCPEKQSKDHRLRACAIVTESNQSGFGLQSAMLSGLRGLRINFSHSDLSFSHLRHANFRESRFFKTQMIGIQAPFIHLVGGDLSHANLSGANLTQCELRGVFAPFANFQRANLSGCRLIRSYFVGAKWDEAILDGVEFIDSIGVPSLR